MTAPVSRAPEERYGGAGRGALAIGHMAETGLGLAGARGHLPSEPKPDRRATPYPPKRPKGQRSLRPPCRRRGDGLGSGGPRGKLSPTGGAREMAASGFAAWRRIERGAPPDKGGRLPGPRGGPGPAVSRVSPRPCHRPAPGLRATPQDRNRPNGQRRLCPRLRPRAAARFAESIPAWAAPSGVEPVKGRAAEDRADGP